MIYNQLNRPDTIPTESGSPMLNTYIEEMKKHGIELVKNGETNVYEMIPLSKDECDINKI